MSCTVLTDKFRTTKKEHICFACGRKFPVKTQMRYQSNIFYGSFCSLYICKTCDEIMSLVDLSDDGEFSEYCVDNEMNQEGFNDPEKFLESLKTKEATHA